MKKIPPMLKPIALLALPLLIITATEVGTKTGTQIKQKEKTIIVKEKEIIHTTTEKVVPESRAAICIPCELVLLSCYLKEKIL